MFRVGQKVVCISDERIGANVYGWESLPKKGHVYTIRELLFIEGKPGLRLFELRNKPGDYKTGFFECAFHRARFRPIVSRPTSIEFAHEILRSVSAPTKERAHV